MHCKDTKYGCCRDNITPAEGPNYWYGCEGTYIHILNFILLCFTLKVETIASRKIHVDKLPRKLKAKKKFTGMNFCEQRKFGDFFLPCHALF